MQRRLLAGSKCSVEFSLVKLCDQDDSPNVLRDLEPLSIPEYIAWLADHNLIPSDQREGLIAPWLADEAGGIPPKSIHIVAEPGKEVLSLAGVVYPIEDVTLVPKDLTNTQDTVINFSDYQAWQGIHEYTYPQGEWPRPVQVTPDNSRYLPVDTLSMPWDPNITHFIRLLGVDAEGRRWMQDGQYIDDHTIIRWDGGEATVAQLLNQDENGS
jgi:hypothetical protein